MAWLSPTNWQPPDKPVLATVLNNLGLDLRTWGGNVDAGGNSLLNLNSLAVITPTWTGYMKHPAEANYEWWLGNFTDASGAMEIVHRRLDGGAWTWGIRLAVDGAVSIGGNASPNFKLTTYGNLAAIGDAPILVLSSVTGGGAASIQMTSPVANANGGPKLYLFGGRDNGAPVAGTSLGGVSFRNLSWGEAAHIDGMATETHTEAASGGALGFWTVANGTTTLLRRMFINQDGQVGIGYAGNPTAKLHLAGDASDNSLKAAALFQDTGAGGKRYSISSRLGLFMVASEDGAKMLFEGDANGNVWVGAVGAAWVMQSIPASAVADAYLRNNEMAVWFDEAYNANAGRLVFRCRTSGGVLKTYYVS